MWQWRSGWRVGVRLMCLAGFICSFLNIPFFILGLFELWIIFHWTKKKKNALRALAFIIGCSCIIPSVNSNLIPLGIWREISFACLKPPKNAWRHKCWMLPSNGCALTLCVQVACLVFVSFGWKLKYFPYEPVNKPFLCPPLIFYPVFLGLRCHLFKSFLFFFHPGAFVWAWAPVKILCGSKSEDKNMYREPFVFQLTVFKKTKHQSFSKPTHTVQINLVACAMSAGDVQSLCFALLIVSFVSICTTEWALIPLFIYSYKYHNFTNIFFFLFPSCVILNLSAHFLSASRPSCQQPGSEPKPKLPCRTFCFPIILLV